MVTCLQGHLGGMYWIEPDNSPQQYTVACCILKGNALATLNDSATAVGNNTLVKFDECLRHTTDHVFPAQALQAQNFLYVA